MDEQKIITAYQNGQSMNSLAKDFHTYATTIRRILEKHNVVLRHDACQEGEVYVQGGEELLAWAKAQGRLVTKSELAKIVGRKKLSPSYFKKYPELGQYVTSRVQRSLSCYMETLYNWLKQNDISYKPNDRTALKGLSVDALLLGDYSNIAIQLTEKATHVSAKQHEKSIKQKSQRAKEVGLKLLLLNKDDFENLDNIKVQLNDLKK